MSHRSPAENPVAIQLNNLALVGELADLKQAIQDTGEADLRDAVVLSREWGTYRQVVYWVSRLTEVPTGSVHAADS
jgi:hypothetical protein